MNQIDYKVIGNDLCVAMSGDTNNDLWTAKALIDNEELVYEVHKMYFEAGADLIITDTYQANVQAFEKVGYSEKEARNLIKKAVKIALNIQCQIIIAHGTS